MGVVNRFWQEFNVPEIINAIVVDVNQREDNVQRHVDRNLLMAWAGSHPDIGHRIFYDEASPELYGDFKPSPEQAAQCQPVLHDALTVSLLLSVLTSTHES